MADSKSEGEHSTTIVEVHREFLEKLRIFLERKYNIQVTGLDRLDRGVFRLDRREGESWVVRVFPAARLIERVQGDADVLLFLEEHDFPAERCAAREPVSSPGGRAVIVTTFVAGTQVERKPSTMQEIGEMLGRLNSLPPGQGRVAREAGALHHYSLSEGTPRSELDAAASWLDEVEGKLPAEGRKVVESLRERLERADDCHGLPEALIHPDPVLKNVIATPDAGLVWIDWTGAGRGPRLAQLAFMIWSGAIGGEGWSGERVDAMVAGYRSRVTLEKEELSRMADAMRVRPLVFACWRYRHAVKSGEVPEGNEWWMPSDELVDAVAARALDAFAG
jgi:Ser/Thr protein kinase RdoA (MazF antagonist)